MLEMAYLELEPGSGQAIFLYDSDTHSSVKDIFEIPGTYEDVCKAHNIVLSLCNMTGKVGRLSLSSYVLVVSPVSQDSAPVGLQYNLEFPKLCGLESVAANALINSYDEETSNLLRKCNEGFEYMRSFTKESSTCLPKEALMYLPQEEQEAFLNSKKFHRADTHVDNVNIIQETCESEFSLALPDIEDIHFNPSGCVSVDSVLKIIAPYRTRANATSLIEYKARMHTPYWRVEPGKKLLMDAFPWINGSAKNSELSLQPNELPMSKKLFMHVCTDTSVYADQIFTGIFMVSQPGLMIRKLLSIQPDSTEALSELMPTVYELIGELKQKLPPYIKFTLTTNDLESLQPEDFRVGGHLAHMLSQHIKIEPEGYLKLVEDHIQSEIPRRIDTSKMDFVLTIDQNRSEVIDKLIANGFISKAMYDFIVQLCQHAYSVNWGHNGVSKAIPDLIDRNPAAIDEYGNTIKNILNAKFGNSSRTRSRSMNANSIDDDSDLYTDDKDDDDNVFIEFTHYLGERNRSMIENGMDIDVSNAFMSENDAVIERYRIYDGVDYLERFLWDCYSSTKDVNILIEAFLKLMRWGTRKPQSLVFMERPEIQTEFDLLDGAIVSNGHIFDENDLIKENDCTYHLGSLLYSDSSIMRQEKPIVGFILYKKYKGERQKYFVASWLDIGEMLETHEVDVSELKQMIPMDEFSRSPIEGIASDAFDFYASPSSKKEAMQINVTADNLCACYKLVERNLLDSAEFRKAVANKNPVGLRDRQYLIAKQYTDVLRSYYSREEQRIASMATTSDLNTIAREIYKAYQDGDNEIVDHNTAAAGRTMSKMNLGVGTQDYLYDNSELSGKFILLDDQERATSWPAISLTDPQLNNFLSKVNKRIVLLMLERPDCYLICAKDIRVSEVRFRTTAEGKQVVYLLKVGKYRDAFLDVKKGIRRTIAQKPIKLHESVKEIF